MDYDFKEEFKRWILEKEKEENLLRNLGASEEIINELRIIDKKIFNSDRKFYRHERVSDSSAFALISNYYSFKDMSKLEVVLEEIENEILYDVISNTDEITFKIFELKFQGYSINEISDILNISRFKMFVLEKIWKSR